MDYRLALSQQAEQAIDLAALWYDQQSKGLGDKFVFAVDHAFHAIQSNPLLYGFRRKELRGYHMRKFPYIIFFIVQNDKIFVTTILHTSRKPTKR